MRIAIIGAGFAGFALAYHLSSNHTIRLFHAGGGASRIAAGLLHPYPGEQGRRSWKADEGLLATTRLLAIVEEALGRPVADRSPILRKLTPQQRPIFAAHAETYQDVILQEDGCLITSGMTIDATLYLEGLQRACQVREVEYIEKRISSLSALQGYDQIILAAGAGALAFAECVPLDLRTIKGQILTCAPRPLEKSLISKGYLIKAEDGLYLGATFERAFTSDAPDLAVASQLLQSKLHHFSELVGELEVTGCRAAVRVAMPHHYTPFVGQVGEKCWAVTGLGSRGLLYHAYLAETLCNNSCFL